MRLTVLGCAGSHPGPGRACSSYLLEADGYRLLLDCGNGSMANLLQVCTARDVDAIIVSHRHLDHWADLVGLYLSLAFDPAGRASVPLYGPVGLDAYIAQVLPDSTGLFPQLCPFTAVAAGDHLELDPFQVELFAAVHPTETVASRVTAGGVVLAYTADSAWTPDLTAAASGADLLVADCTWPQSGEQVSGMHMTAADAGRLATAAGVRRLLVTHVWPGYDPVEVAAEAAEHFAGEVYAAADLQVFEFDAAAAPVTERSSER
jgi:ribonuclease BN (tRNA processing enzyme)